MNTLRYKCFAGSLAMHGLLCFLVLFGSGFLAPPRQTETLPVLTFVPDKLVDQMLAGGGGRPAAATTVTPSPGPPSSAVPRLVQLPKPIQPAPRAVQPAPRPVPQSPKPVRETRESKPKASKPKAVEPAPKPEGGAARKRDVSPKPEDRAPTLVDVDKATKTGRKKPKVEADMTPATLPSKGPDVAEAQAAEARAAAERAAVEHARQLLAARNQEFLDSVSGLQDRLSSGTEISVPGTGGETYANYGLFVRTIYDWAWLAPQDVADQAATVKVKVVIGRDGTVLTTEVLSKSGVPALDKSVREALDRVTTIGKPFPEGAREDERMFILNFNLKSKRAVT